MRALTATTVFAVTTLGAAVLSSASSIGAATDGLTSDSILAGANVEAAFSGSAVRVPDDPDAPIRTGRWAEDAAPVELAGGPAQVASAPPEPILLSRPNVPAPEQSRVAVLDSRLSGPAPTTALSVPLSRVAWAPVAPPRTVTALPRIDLTVSNREPGAPGAGLDADSGVFSEPLAIARSSPAPMFDIKRLTLRVGPSEADRKKGRWFVFAAGSGEAFGLNLVRDPLRGWRPAGWSVEQLAEFGKAQLGIGWRKGSQQLSASVARREISAYGLSREDTIFGITFSVSGKPPARTRYEQRLPRARQTD